MEWSDWSGHDNKAVILNNDQLKKRKDTSRALIYNTAPFSTQEFLMKACLIPTSDSLQTRQNYF